MSFNDTYRHNNRIPNSLNFTQNQVNFILGHSLASIYRDTLEASLPDHLQALVDRLEVAHRSERVRAGAHSRDD